MYCPKCGQQNIDTAKFCSSCGNPFDVANPHAVPLLPGSDPQSTDTETLYRVFIGSNNQHYYLNQFQQFDRAGQTKATWHWPAFFVTWYWLLYRKMWLAALIYFLLPYIVLFVGGLLTALIPGLGGVLFGLLWIAYVIGIFVWYPMNANAMYYKHCQNKIQEAKVASSRPDAQLGILASKGGTSNIVVILVVVFAFIFMIGILAAIAIPAYQDYVTRSKLAQALIIGNQAEAAVTQYYQQQEKLPATLEEAGFNSNLPHSVEKIALDESADGTVAITMADGPVKGQKIYLVPSLEADKSLSWKCMSTEIKDHFLPKVCRQQ